MSATASRMSLGKSIGATGRAGRIGLWLNAVAAVIVVLAAVYYLVLAAQWRAQPFLGVLLTHTLTVDGSLPVSSSGWAGLQAGMQRGDHVVAVNDRALPNDYSAAAAEFAAALRALQPGDPVTLTFERPAVDGSVTKNHSETCTQATNGAALCGVTFTPGVLPDGDFFASFLIPFISGLITLGIGIAVLALRARSPSAQVV